jgi:hypothetical protein
MYVRRNQWLGAEMLWVIFFFASSWNRVGDFALLMAISFAAHSMRRCWS